MNAAEGIMRASDRAYSSLRADIIQWRLSPGTVLAEVEQSRRLGISRTPLREALARLTTEGLVAAHPGRGVVVTHISLDRMTELFDVRIPLDCRAAELAANAPDRRAFEDLTRRFKAAPNLIAGQDPEQLAYYTLVGELDAAIDAAADNAYLLQAQRQLRTHLVRVRQLAKDNPIRLLASATEHQQIARSIHLGNPDLAAAATRVHLHNSLHHLLTSEPAQQHGLSA
ncbi:GntR family transcriptional regulator [Arthrobacter roseus]